jgi:hypothetical protein
MAMSLASLLLLGKYIIMHGQEIGKETSKWILKESRVNIKYKLLSHCCKKMKLKD